MKTIQNGDFVFFQEEPKPVSLHKTQI